MSGPDDQAPLTGEAAWQDRKRKIAARNEAAYARGRERRAERDAAYHAERLERERAERADVPREHRGR